MPDSRADGIVVLTGGVARVDEAVKLLNEKKGERLLISGVHPSASRAVLAKTFAVDEDRFNCCVDVDHEALDTVGNAVETADWVAEHGYHSLLVVTNDYHMPRSLLELHSVLSDVELIPHAVVASQHQNGTAAEPLPGAARRIRKILRCPASHAGDADFGAGRRCPQGGADGLRIALRPLKPLRCAAPACIA